MYDLEYLLFFKGEKSDFISNQCERTRKRQGVNLVVANLIGSETYIIHLLTLVILFVQIQFLLTCVIGGILHLGCRQTRNWPSATPKFSSLIT